jgi:hypothetical protein
VTQTAIFPLASNFFSIFLGCRPVRMSFDCHLNDAIPDVALLRGLRLRVFRWHWSCWSAVVLSCFDLEARRRERHLDGEWHVGGNRRSGCCGVSYFLAVAGHGYPFLISRVIAAPLSNRSVPVMDGQREDYRLVSAGLVGVDSVEPAGSGPPFEANLPAAQKIFQLLGF